MSTAAPNEAPAAPTPAGQAGWISFEMAGGPYFNVVKIFVFAPFFAATVVGDPVRGQELWGYIEGTAGLFIAAVSLILGPAVDFYGARKPGMLVATAIAALSIAALWFAAPGSAVLPIALALVLAAVCTEAAYVYHNSLLTFIAAPGRVGLVSGIGYSAGYLGTLIVFIPYLALIAVPETPPFGLDPQAGEEVRIVGPIAAIWFIAFAIPFFLFTKDVAKRGPPFLETLRLGQRRLIATIRHARHYENILRFLIVRMVYADGLTATFAFVGIYAAANFGWGTAEVGLYGLVIFSVMVFAGVIGGHIDDLIGSKRTILLSLLVFIASMVLNFGIRPDQLFYGVPYDTEGGGTVPFIGPVLAGLGFETLPEQLFVLNGALGGFFVAPCLSSSRVMLTRLAPPSMIAEFFGLFTLTGRATAFLAPFLIAVVTSLTGDVRMGFSVVFAFLITGFIGMLSIREERTEASH